VYDLVCTAIYGDYNMALKIDGKDDNITRKLIIEFAGRFGLKADVINSNLDELISKFQKNLEMLYMVTNESKKVEYLKRLVKKRITDLK